MLHPLRRSTVASQLTQKSRKSRHKQRKFQLLKEILSSTELDLSRLKYHELDEQLFHYFITLSLPSRPTVKGPKIEQILEVPFTIPKMVPAWLGAASMILIR